MELGRRLFFDPRVSRAGMRSCADCHDPKHGFADRERLSADDRGRTRRHSQTLIDGADRPSLHWDGAFRRVEDLITARITLASRGEGGSGHEFSGAAPRAGIAAETQGSERSLEGLPAGPAATGIDSALADELASRDSGETVVEVGATERPDENPMRDYCGDGAPPPAGLREPTATAPSPGAPDAPPGAPTPNPSAPVTTPSQPAPAAGAPSDPAAAAPAAGDARGAGPAAAPPPARPDPAAATPSSSMSSDDPLASAFSAYGDPLGSFLAPQLENAKLPIADQALEAAGRYREAFTSAFGTPEVTVARIAEAIADYCHTIRSGTSAYDRFAAGDTTALSPEARRGLDLFQGKAGCAQCHTMAGERATFTDDQFHDTGVTWSGQHAKDDVQRLELADRADLGAADVTGRVKARRAFRTPTLRDVARRGPFMHDGSLRTLAAVVRHYDRGTTDPLADPRLPKMDLDNLEAAALVEFLRALTSEERPGLASTAWRERAPSTRLRFVDATGAALADLQVKLIAAGDRLPGIDPNDLDGWKARTDEAGWISYEPPLSTHVRVVLPDGLRAETGALVPDTCREAVIAVPVHGRVHLLVTLPAGVAAPPTIVAVHVDAQVFPDRRRPRTVFRSEGMTKAGDKLVALYGAPERTDVPPRVLLHLPVRAWGMDQLHLTLDPARTTRLDLSK